VGAKRKRKGKKNRGEISRKHTEKRAMHEHGSVSRSAKHIWEVPSPPVQAEKDGLYLRDWKFDVGEERIDFEGTWLPGLKNFLSDWETAGSVPRLTTPPESGLRWEGEGHEKIRGGRVVGRGPAFRESQMCANEWLRPGRDKASDANSKKTESVWGLEGLSERAGGEGRRRVDMGVGVEA